jgi:glycosyltransferase involved in cell wall biosynthesis
MQKRRKMKLSVIICTHNPRPTFISRTLEALRQQTLPMAEWELLMIDNVSHPRVSDLVTLDWHPNAHHFREEVLGLTPARLLGIQKSQGKLLVFVDDDNLLDKNYLANALKIYDACPFLGAFGASIEGEFEVDPPLSIRPYLEALAIRPTLRDHWSNARKWSEATPYGAGMCVRREVAELYLERVRNNRLSFALGRTGTSLSAGEDTDMGWTSILLNKGTGCFARLRLCHLIPKDRLTESYIERLQMGSAYAEKILEQQDARSMQNHKGKVWNAVSYWAHYITASRLGRRLMKARRAGHKAAREAILNVRGASPARKPEEQEDLDKRTLEQSVPNFL